MTDQEGKYNIKAASKILGIQSGTLRAWERRYQMVAPVRNEAGHRLYTDEHIKILKWLIGKINQGFTIGQAVSLLENNELHHTESVEQGSKFSELIDELLNAFIQFDERKAQEVINTCLSLYTTDKVITEVFGTVLIKIGKLWEIGKITSAHEHFATAILRSRVGMILHSFPLNSLLPKVVTICAPGEWHEMGLMMFTLFLRRKGFDVVYLGSSIAEQDIDEVLQIIKPKFLFISCTLKDNGIAAVNLANRLASEYKSMHIGLGGNAIDTLGKPQKDKIAEFIVGGSVLDWEHWLKEKITRE
ncbi:MAG: MerR family transcriptional regulator [Bacillota bacterium]|nr:MerR family transcriptional regulator [Bacillota bacterium]